MKRVASREPDKKHELHEDSWLKNLTAWLQAGYPSVPFRAHQEAVLETAKSNFCEVETLKPVIGIFIFVPDWSR